jgi:hypothetical protein
MNHALDLVQSASWRSWEAPFCDRRTYGTRCAELQNAAHGPVDRTVVHFGKHDPRARMGGVEAFARNLALVFREVLFMTPSTADFARVQRERLPMICDNQYLRYLPRELPAIGFQHGVAFDKLRVTKRFAGVRMAVAQRRVASRPNTVWVACAEWISRRFAELHGNGAAHVIHHQVDLERFDGRLDNVGSRLVLHDARSEAKGKSAVAALAAALPEYRFEPLACAPSEVADRMRTARAFVHLSRYEGNSIVCNEAMASNLPCLFTRVGLLRDASGPSEVVVVEPEIARREPRLLVTIARDFLASLETRDYQPRAWILRNASLPVARERWTRALSDLDRLW